MKTPSGDTVRGVSRAPARTAFGIAFVLATSLALAEQPVPGAEPAAAAERLDILEFRVLGNSVLPARAVEAAVYPHLGPGRSFQDIEAARLALETAYHEAGFGTVYVDIPEQRVEGGIVRLRATEGRVHAVHVAGARYFSGRDIRAALPAAAAGTVPSVPALQAELAAVNAESPDRSVVPVLKAGPVPGTVDLELNVEDHLPLHLAAELNNQYSADTRPLRASLTADYANLFGRLDSLSAQYQASPQQAGNVGVLAVSYARRLNEAAHLTFNYINSSSSVASLGALDVVGKGHMYGLRYDRNVVASPGHLETVSVGFDYKRFDQTVNAGLGATVATPIAYGLLSTSYSGTVVAPQRVWTWSAGAGLVLRGVGSGPGAFDDKCYACRQTEIALHGEASVTQALGAGFSLVLRGAAQLAPDPLVSNEQFLLGGAQTVRGYYEAEELGDVGYRSTLELQAPNLLRGSSLHVRPFLFGDRGRIRTLAPLSGQTASSRLASAGAGLNFDWTRALGGNLTWARTLEPGARTPDGESRWMFVVRSLW